MTKKILMTYPEVVAVGELLKKHCHKVEGTDVWAYEEGWNDERVAQTVHPRLTPHNVDGLRVKLLGRLYSKRSDAVERDPRVDRLVENFDKLLHQLANEGVIDATSLRVSRSDAPPLVSGT